METVQISKLSCKLESEITSQLEKLGSEHTLVELEMTCVIFEKIKLTITDTINTKAPELLAVLTWTETSEVFPAVAVG